MTKLHQLLDAGLPVDDALALAQRDLMKSQLRHTSTRGAQDINWHNDIHAYISSGDNSFASPYYWAPFIVIGGKN